MSAIVTDKIKKQILLDLFKDFDSSATRYYAGIGRSEQWNQTDTVTVPTVSERTERDARLNMQSMKNITDKSFVVPRSNWSLGAQYSAYDDNTEGYPAQAFYVMNSNQEVYICLQQGRDATGSPVNSTEQPTGNTTGVPFTTSDGYVWKFIYSIGALRASKFLSSAYMPVQFVDSDEAASNDATAEQVEQRAVELAATAGEIVGAEVLEQGSNYTQLPTVQVIGDGEGCELVPIISGNALVNLQVKQDSSGNLSSPSTNPLNWTTGSYRGRNYKRASVHISGGGGSAAGATGRVILGPKNGLGADPRDDLKTGAVMFNTKADGDEGGDFLIGNDIFRQVLLIRNPLVRDSAGRSDTDLFTDATGNTLDRVQVASIGGNGFLPSTTVTATSGASPRAAAFVDAIDSVGLNNNARLLVHQNETTGLRAFNNGDEISDGASTGTISSYLRGEVDPLSGELLYIDNRAAVDRSLDQTEDLKIVIQL